MGNSVKVKVGVGVGGVGVGVPLPVPEELPLHAVNRPQRIADNKNEANLRFMTSPPLL